MWLQQWARSHYSALLPEMRKWELYPEGLITFDVFADSLHTLGFPAAGRWQEVEAVFYSWEPDDRAWHAYAAFEEVELPRLKEENPRLKMSQYKEQLAKMWKKDSRNPQNFPKE